jgi:hypothetical protein
MKRATLEESASIQNPGLYGFNPRRNNLFAHLTLRRCVLELLTPREERKRLRQTFTDPSIVMPVFSRLISNDEQNQQLNNQHRHIYWPDASEHRPPDGVQHE